MADNLSLGILPPSFTQNVAPPAATAAANGKTAEDAQRAKIQHSAEEFESILLAQWLEKAREAFAGVPGGSDEDNDDPGAGQLMGLGMQALASAVTKSGGIGIARMIRHSLEQQSGAGNMPIPEKSQKGLIKPLDLPITR